MSLHFINFPKASYLNIGVLNIGNDRFLSYILLKYFYIIWNIYRQYLFEHTTILIKFEL